MRLLSLYITAFGGVRERAFTFKEGLCEICEPNGAGKSTLAAFIKVMLFGFGKEGHSLEKNEAKLYEPWQGGRFGGTLTFQNEGKRYRIERYFERTGKVKLREELLVIDEASGLPTDAFGEEIGRALFGVDGPSFMKTAYLSSRGITAGKTADISAKLGGIEGEEDDMAAFDRAISLLKDKRREIRTQNNQKNGQKQLDLAERELFRVRSEIAVARAAEEQLTLLFSDMEEEKKRAAALDSTLASLRAEKSALDRRLGERKETERRLAELHARLERERTEERALLAAFPSGTPSREALDALARDAAEAERLSLEVEAFRSENATLYPDGETVTAMRRAVRRRDELKTKLYDFAESEPHTAKNSGHAMRACFLLAAVSAALGIAAFFFLIPLAIGLLALGACLAIGGTALLIHAKQEGRAAAEKAAAYAEWKAEYTRAEEEAGDLFVRFGLLRNATVYEIDALYERGLRARMERERAERAKEAQEALREQLEGALSLYPTLPADASAARRVMALRTLTEELRMKQESVLDLKSEIVHLSENLKGKDAGGEAEKSDPGDLLLRTEAARAALTASLAEKGQRTEECARLAGALPALLEYEAACDSTVCALTERLQTLDKTLTLLTEARASYEEAYLGGVRAHIKTYTDRLLTSKVGEAQLDLDLALSFTAGGEAHEATYLSTGLLAIADICLRLALTDALYPKEPPPLLLDDPFATLDEGNLAAALSLLCELGKERQILYLTCHPSRCTKK